VDIIIDSVKNPSREAKALTINLRPWLQRATEI
jgi:hypothetical protein